MFERVEFGFSDHGVSSHVVEQQPVADAHVRQVPELCNHVDAVARVAPHACREEIVAVVFDRMEKLVLRSIEYSDQLTISS